MQKNKIYVGDNIEILKNFPDNSIDSVVTDPPYGLGKEPNAIEVLTSWIEKGYHEIKGKGFMGKEWDAFVPQPNFWKEIYRVLKPGGYVLSFAGTRTYDWMVMGLRLAGFEIRDQIAWIYGSGFPKSMDISKALDKYLGAEREVIGKEIRYNEPSGIVNVGQGERKLIERKITSPSTEEAKQWQGWGTALKPALEPIVMARKPLDGTVAQNVLKWGVGGINIDECRVEVTELDNYDLEQRKISKAKGIKEDGTFLDAIHGKDMKHGVVEKGRFPANVIHDGSEEVVSLFPNSKSGEYKGEGTKSGGIWSESTGQPAGREYGDEGSASRFFYTAKASQSERNFGLSGFEEKSNGINLETQGRTYNSRCANCGKKFIGPIETICNCENPITDNTIYKQKNIHPTVKPIDLMRYLVRLVTPKGGVCLDPFLGSGTTAVACKVEKFDYIGIELIPEYAEIAQARVDAVKDYEATLDTKTIIKESIKEEKEKEYGIQNIFDFIGE